MFLPPDSIFIIAEAGVNHNGERDLAFQLIEAAAESGADAVKFQTFDAAKLVTGSAPKAIYQQMSTGAGESQREMLSTLQLTRSDLGSSNRMLKAKDVEVLLPGRSN